MNEQDILQFKISLTNLSIDELESKRSELQNNISKMIMQSDDIVKIVIIENLLKQKLEKETNGTSESRTN